MFCLFLKNKYKESGRKETFNCLYSKLPETLDTQHAKEASQLQSQVSGVTSGGQRRRLDEKMSTVPALIQPVVRRFCLIYYDLTSTQKLTMGTNTIIDFILF